MKAESNVTVSTTFLPTTEILLKSQPRLRAGFFPRDMRVEKGNTVAKICLSTAHILVTVSMSFKILYFHRLICVSYLTGRETGKIVGMRELQTLVYILLSFVFCRNCAFSLKLSFFYCCS